MKCELRRNGAWVPATWDAEFQRWHIPGERRITTPRPETEVRVPSRPITPGSDELPSDTQRAPSDYVPNAEARNGTKLRPVFHMAGVVMIGGSWREMPDNPRAAWVDSMRALSTWPVYEFDRSLVVWPSPDYPMDQDGRGLSVMEKRYIDAHAPNALAA